MSKNAPDVRAFIVTCPDDDHGADVVFCKSANDARQCRDGSTCDCNYLTIRAKRAPHLDQYAPGPVSMLTLMSHGWFAYCAFCEMPVYEDTEGFVHADNGTRIFCNQKCADRYAELWPKPDALPPTPTASTEAK